MKIRLVQYGDGKWVWEQERASFDTIKREDHVRWYQSDMTRYDSRGAALDAAQAAADYWTGLILKTKIVKQEELEI